MEVIWPKNTTTPLSVCGLEVRLPLREAVVISLHLSGFVSNSTGPAPVLVEIGFAGDDTVIHEVVLQIRNKIKDVVIVGGYGVVLRYLTLCVAHLEQ